MLISFILIFKISQLYLIKDGRSVSAHVVTLNVGRIPRPALGQAGRSEHLNRQAMCLR